MATTPRVTVITSGLLCIALALVVLFSSPTAFRSPLAIVLMACVGTAAVLLQLRLRKKSQGGVLHPPLWLNVVGIALALIVLFPGMLHISPRLVQVMATGAVGSFAVSSAIVLYSLRKQAAKQR
jgi:hypothetical protein